jgi:hypothetical protein
MRMRYIKNNVTKHITPILFYPHQLKESGEISILQFKSCDNPDIFMKSLPFAKFDKCVKCVDMR